MFGYIKPYTPELKMKEHEAFRAVYCGLCHQLGQSFGVFARLTLNFDFVFLAMLYYAQQKEMPGIISGRCAVNPLQRVPLCKSDQGMVYSADIAALMIYYKLEDNVVDSGGIKRLGWKIARRLLKGKWNKAANREPEADRIVCEMMKKQQRLEAELPASIDRAAEPTAAALSQIAGRMVEEGDPRRPDLERLGYLMGRYIYLCDAVEDLEKDLKTGNYNPLVVRFLAETQTPEEIAHAREQGRDSLYMTIGEMGGLLEQLELAYFAPIIHNIIQLGMKHSVEELLKVDE